MSPRWRVLAINVKTIGLFVIEGIFGAVIVALLGPVFTFFINLITSQKIPTNEILAVTGIVMIIVFAIIAYSLVMKLKNYLVARKKPTDTTAEYLFDDLLKEIEKFIRKWKKGPPFVSGYRRQIELKSMWGDRVKIGKHETEIRTAVRALRNAIINEQVWKLLDLLDSIEVTLNKMVDLGSEVEIIFETQKDIKNTRPEKFGKLLSRGNIIRDELSIHKANLKKLRGTLP